MGFQPSSRRGHPVLFRISVRPLRYVRHPSSAVSLVAASVFLVSFSSAPLELSLLVDYPSAGVVEPESAAVPIDSITSDVQPQPHPVLSSFSQDHFHALSPILPDILSREWPPGWKRRLCEPYQLGNETQPIIAASARQSRYQNANDNEILVYINQHNEIFIPMFLFQYAASHSDRLDARGFVLSTRLEGHEHLTLAGDCNMHTPCSGWLC